MQPIGPLMIEHRLIERMIAQMKEEAERVGEGKPVDTAFVDAAVDFLRVYADRCHHGKEEDILFRELKNKNIKLEDGRVMRELMAEHVTGRENVTDLDEANKRLREGDESGEEEAALILGQLAEFYPRHIEKEDTIFFPSSMQYFNQKEQEAMLKEMREFDAGLIHETYEKVVEEYE